MEGGDGRGEEVVSAKLVSLNRWKGVMLGMNVHDCARDSEAEGAA